MKWGLRIALVTIAILLASCGGSGSPGTARAPAPHSPTAHASPAPTATAGAGPAPSAPPSATPSPPAPPSPRPTDLQASGGISGQAPVVQTTGVCGQTGPSLSAQGNFTVGGAGYVLTIEILDYHGPGTYPIPPERVSVRGSDPNANVPLRPALKGTISVDPSGRSGTLDADLGPAGSTQTHVTGAWVCA